MNRIKAVRTELSNYKIDGLLITSPPNRQYMTHFFGTAGLAIVSEQDAIFITDFRYMDQAQEQVKGYDIIEHTGPIFEEVAKQVERLGIKKLGFESNLTYDSFDTLSTLIKAA